MRMLKNFRNKILFAYFKLRSAELLCAKPIVYLYPKSFTMSKRVFTTKFNYSMPSEELKKIMPAVAPKFSEIPGCSWKIWLINEDQKEAGGVYLFESAEELEQFLKGPLFASVANNPSFSNLQTSIFGVNEAASEITGAPLMKMAV